MRPDEHKKRKNTQYKKKHGISGKDDKQEADSKKLPKDKGEKEKHQVKNDKPAVDKEIKGKVKEEKTDKQELEYDDFRRRKLVSNWSRYDDSSDDDNDEDIPAQRGEDFNKLLTEAGGSAAQFRFKDEEDWTEDQPGGVDSVLALDLEKLAESLSCVQLHERLGIDKNLLMEEQILEIKAVASENERNYYLKYPKDSCDLINEKKPSVTCSTDANNVKTVSNTPKTKAEIGNNAKDSSVMKSADKKVNKTDNVHALNNNPTSAGKNEAQSKSKNKEILSLEDDLDMLLSLDEPSEVSSGKNIEVVSHSKPLKDADKVKNADKTKTSAGNAPDTAALEDWLDSMLDE